MEYQKYYEYKYKEIEQLLDVLPISIFAINQLFRIIRLNETALKLINSQNYKENIDELCYKKIHFRSDICPFCPLKEEWKQIDFTNKKFQKIERIINKKDQNSEKIYKIVFILFPTGTIRIIEIIEDITKEIEKQEEIIRIENLATLGTMISGIAHEINNPLTGISLNLQNLIYNITSFTEISEEKKKEILNRLKLIQKDLIKASYVVSDILSLSRPGIKEKHKLELQKIILKAKENILRIYPLLSNKIQWIIQDAKPIYLYGNPDKLERMFFNLFKNSIQAYDYKEGIINIRFKFSKNNVMLILYDEAGGIPKEIIKKIFVPFASTKYNTKGSGLGLSICYNIVREHQGKIKVKSFDGKTVFFILLPIVNET